MAGRETDLRPSSRTAINVKMPTNYPESETQQTANHSAPITPSAHITVAFAKADGDAQKQNSVLESIESPIEAQKASELNHQIAALIIERTWISYRNKQMFRLLKHSVCAAEYSLSYEILRKVIPREAQLLNDKSQQVKIRFRFGGEEFPPMIFFKIFIHHAGQKVKYLSGRKMIRPATEAAEDSLRQMGNRTFYDQILKDILWQQNCSITDEIDVTTLKDYMQYLANLDESPAWQGGKENCWRKLTLDVLPRRTIFFDVVDFAYNKQITPRLKEEIHILMSRPVTQDIQIQHIQAISKMRTHVYTSALTPSKSKMSRVTSHSQTSSRRSKSARLKALKMRRLYSRENAEEQSSRIDDDYHYGTSEEEAGMYDDGEDELDKEANKLYEWTQELSFHDDAMQTSLVTI